MTAGYKPDYRTGDGLIRISGSSLAPLGERGGHGETEFGLELRKIPEFFLLIHCHLRLFYYISNRIAVFQPARRDFPRGLSFPKRARYNLPWNRLTVKRQPVTSCHAAIGETAYGDEGGVVCTHFCRDNDRDPEVTRSGS